MEGWTIVAICYPRCRGARAIILRMARTETGSALQRFGRKMQALLGVTVVRGTSYDVGLYDALRSLRTWTPEDRIFDVGANEGRTVLRLARELPAPQIFAFEPTRRTYEVLRSQTAHLENVRPYRLAFFRSDADATSPALEDTAAVEPIDVTNIDDFAATHATAHLALLRVDVRSGGLEVLRGAERMLSKGLVNIVQVEIGFFGSESHGSFDALRSYLAGFDVFLYGIYDQRRGRPVAEWTAPTPELLVGCDVLFVSARAPW